MLAWYKFYIVKTELDVKLHTNEYMLMCKLHVRPACYNLYHAFSPLPRE